MPQHWGKILALSLICLAAVAALPWTGQAQYGIPLMPRGIQPWMEKLEPNQRSAFLKLFTDLGSIDSTGSLNVALLSEDWNKTMAAVSGEGSLAQTEAWCHLAMLVFKELLDKSGYLQATALAKLIFSDGFTVIESHPQNDYGQWADFCRMKSYEMQQYTMLHGRDNHAVEMTQRFLEWGNKYPSFWGKYQAELSGGICPTFIQPPQGGTVSHPVESRREPGLVAAIAIPSDGCLLSSDIPIYGVAGGRGFEHYRVEYGAGADPDGWRVIAESDIPRDSFSLSDVPDLLEGDLDLRGNLATWNVGLRNWEHLPWHPASDTTDFSGIYTIRLTTLGRGGESAESRVVCEVGRAVAQCLPGSALSADRKVTLRFPEQSLTGPFRVFTVRPAGAESPVLPEGQKLIGEIYRVREGGERFIKPVTLEMSYADTFMGPASSLGIFTYDAMRGSWHLLATARDEKRIVLSTDLTSLGAPRAYFAVLSSEQGSIQSEVRSEAVASGIGFPRRTGSVLLRDDFETGLGGWSSRGPATSVVRVVDKNGVVRVTKEPEGGNLACNIVTTAFDVREFPLVSFDYSILKDTKVDFFVRSGPRWYDIGFTGDPADFRNKDVNIIPAGRIPGIVSDGLWHHAGVDLGDLLGQKTRNTLVEEMILADWKVSGYMKLEFGDNAAGASVSFDNFTIARDTAPAVKTPWRGDSILVADFEDGGLLNLLGGSQALFSNPGTNNCSVEVTGHPLGGSDGSSLLIRYDVRNRGQYSGWLTTLEGIGLETWSSLEFDMYAEGSVPECLIGLKNTHSREVKVPLRPYLGAPSADGWRRVSVPMVAFTGLAGFESMENVSFTFGETYGSGSGSIRVDNIRFRRGQEDPEVLKVDDFEGPELNALGAGGWIFKNGAATIQAEKAERPDDHGHAMMISYGGSIGLDLGRGGFSYAGWVSGLGGIDISGYDSLQASLSGGPAGGEVNLYLDDGNRRYPVKAACQGAADGGWRQISIPLQAYAAHGVDLTHAEGLQLVFEWKKMSGTLLVDDISLLRVKKATLLTTENHGGSR